MSVINVDHLTKDYGSGRGVFDVTFEVNEGEVFGFLGPNGAGKSTTIRHLMGFSKPQKGDTKIFELSTFNNYYKILSKVGYIPGEIALPAGLTGREFLSMMQHLQGIKNDEMLKHMLELFELKDNVLKGDTKSMSLGTKRRLAIVAAFMSDPKVLILDEPTSGLDPIKQETFIKFIKEEKAKGKTILLSSHIFSEVDATCDRIGIIKDGKLVSTFVADDLKHKKLKKYLITFKSYFGLTNFIEKLKESQNVKLIDFNKEKRLAIVQVEDSNLNEFIKAISKYQISNITNEQESLEDYFMKFYKEDKEFKGV